MNLVTDRSEPGMEFKDKILARNNALADEESQQPPAVSPFTTQSRNIVGVRDLPTALTGNQEEQKMDSDEGKTHVRATSKDGILQLDSQKTITRQNLAGSSHNNIEQ